MEAITFGEPFALASITASELLVGVHKSASPQPRLRRLSLIESVLSRVPVIAFDLAMAETHARLTAELSLAGRLIGAHDMLIAATALTDGYGLLTHNLRHFQQVPGLDVAEPIW